jgi:N6-adenosine-specific RNA methylase IME4
MDSALPLWFPDRAILPPRRTAPLPTTEGGWKMVSADPAWKFKNWADPVTAEQIRASRGAERHYPTLTMDDIMALEVKDVVARDCHCMLWITGPFIDQGAAVLESWGFRFSTLFMVWIKLRKGLIARQFQLLTLAELVDLLHTGAGKTSRKNAEFVLLGRRGNPERLVNDVHEVIIAPRRQHSRKPDEYFERLERYAPGPRLELFARQPRAGWTVWGNETDRFPA